MKQNYVTAVCDLILQGMDITDILTGLTKTLKDNGHTALHVHVLQGVVLKLEQVQKTSLTSLVVAEQTDVEKLKQTITASLQKIGGSIENAIITTDKTIVGGFVATHNGNSIDASHKGKLIQLYRNITA